MRSSAAFIASALLCLSGAVAATDLAPGILSKPTPPSAAMQPFVKVPAGRVALMHVRVIDGTGSAPLDDRMIVLDGGRIVSVGPAGKPPKGATVLDLRGHTVLPGIVGMHDHMYYIGRPNLEASGHFDAPVLAPQMTFTSPRLYLANGVTTMRTTGSVEPYADLNLKRLIDTGQVPGPHMDVTAPYLEGAGSLFVQMHELRDANDARETVAYWAEQGATSFKAYMKITRDELKAAVDEAHRHGLKITGHLCSVTYPEAIALGIDNLEHGFFVNTQLDPGKKPDQCPATTGLPTLVAMTPDSPTATALIRDLVAHHVAVTSTLPVFEIRRRGNAPLLPAALAVLTPEARQAYFYQREQIRNRADDKARDWATAYKNDIALERRFVQAGGLLLAGPDPTGDGGVIPGFGDLRGIELLVDAGFKPEEAVKIATLNGATYLGLDRRIGSVEAGKDADLLVVKGDPSHDVRDIEHPVIVFKDGIGYDSVALLDSVRGRYGEY
jgi:imidazolonepropionase-like amidohydrolase